MEDLPDSINIPAQGDHKIVKMIAPFLAGSLATFILLTAVYFTVLVPKQNNDLNKRLNELQEANTNLNNTKNNEIANTTEGFKPQSNSLYQRYNWDQVKEFYTIKTPTTTTEWVPLSSEKVGISFEYPVGANKLILFEFNEWPKQETDPTGTEFTWKVRDPESEYGGDNIAWGSSKDLLLGRMSVDIYNWTEEAGKYFIHSSQGKTYEVEKLAVYDLSFGTQALLYNSPCFYFCDDPSTNTQKVRRVLIANLPADLNTEIESVSFSIPDSFLESDINKIVESIKLIE